jgi:hypothetical protein
MAIMKERFRGKSASLMYAFLVCASHTGSAVILLVDFNDDSPPALTQSGFSAFAPTGSPGTRPYSTTIGNLDVTISGHDVVSTGGFFDRGSPANSGAFTFSDLYRDFAFHNNGGTITVGIAGIQPNTPYQLNVWSSDRFDGGAFANTITNTVATGGATTGTGGTITFNRTVDATSDLHHSFTGTFQSTTSTLTFSIRATEGSLTRLNGFALVPEPSSAALIGMGGCVLLLRRRR